MGALLNQRNWLKSLPHYHEMKKVLGPYDDSKDYVGAEGDWKSKFIPRKFYGADINVCAYVHDYYYQVGGNDTDRFFADAAFLADIMKQIELTPVSWYHKVYCRRHLARLRGLKYFEAVRTFGSKAFAFKEDKWKGIK